MKRDRDGAGGRMLKLSLVAGFLAATSVAGSRRAAPAALLDPLELCLTGLAAHRIGRMVAFEKVAEPVREPFTATVPDESGADETVVARGRGVQWAIGQLLSCPVCVATWSALGLSVGHLILPGPTRFVVRVLAIAGIAELNYVATERLEWAARAARRQSA
ncbi:MAG: DUF1360 domain-containing protein [Chloroflexi bacterium]|nr:DUF1360 domain-containing protein [Chloroflexota bacterium]